MKHRAPHLATALVFGILTSAALGCGDKKSPGSPAGSGAASAATPDPKDAPAVRDELPPAPETAMRKGKARLINLLADAKTGKTDTVDVWAVRSFKYGPARLVEGLKFGQASAWFTAAEGMSVVAVPAGAPGESKDKLTSVSVPTKPVNETSILYRDRDGSAICATPGGMPEPSSVPADKALVVLDASQLMGFETQLTASPLGGRSFQVGDGNGTCLTGAAVLGGTNHTHHEVAPGPFRFTLHKWPGDCKSEPVAEVKVDGVAGKGQIVYLHTADGKSLSQLVVPLE